MSEIRLMERMGERELTAIDSGALVSAGVPFYGRPILGLLVPAVNGAAALNVEISLDGGANYYDLLTAGGTAQAIAITGGAAAFMVSSDDLSPLAGYVADYEEEPILTRLVASATQTAEREFVWLMLA